jgi:antitoxin (DNA-binding transcriptional repressor) of toxin-antitoxin stability system
MHMSERGSVRYGGRKAVSATEAARNFGRLVDAVRESHVEYVVERGGVGVVRIVPFVERAFRGRDLVELLRRATGPAEELVREVKAGRELANRPRVPRNPWAS